jgi:hypothetical protein
MTPQSAADLLWVTWFVSWVVAGVWSDAAVTRPAVRSEIVYRLLAIVGAFLLFGLAPSLLAGERILWHVPSWLGWPRESIANLDVSACGRNGASRLDAAVR